MKSRQIVLIDRQAYRLRVEDYRRIEIANDPNQLKEILMSIKRTISHFFQLMKYSQARNKL